MPDYTEEESYRRIISTRGTRQGGFYTADTDQAKPHDHPSDYGVFPPPPEQSYLKHVYTRPRNPRKAAPSADLEPGSEHTQGPPRSLNNYTGAFQQPMPRSQQVTGPPRSLNNHTGALQQPVPRSQQVTGSPQSLPMTQSSSRQNPPAQIPYSSGFQGGYPPYGNSTADGQQNRHQGQDTASPPNNPSVPFAAQPAPTYPRSTPGSQPQGYSNAPYASVSEGAGGPGTSGDDITGPPIHPTNCGCNFIGCLHAKEKSSLYSSHPSAYTNPRW